MIIKWCCRVSRLQFWVEFQPEPSHYVQNPPTKLSTQKLCWRQLLPLVMKLWIYVLSVKTVLKAWVVAEERCFSLVTSHVFWGFGKYPNLGPSVERLVHHSCNLTIFPAAAASSAAAGKIVVMNAWAETMATVWEGLRICRFSNNWRSLSLMH